MAIANVQIKSGIADDTASISITPDSNVTAGNLLIVYAMKYSPSDADVFVAGDLSKSSGTATIGTVTLDVQNLWDAGSDGVMAGIYSVPVTGTGSLTLQITGDSGCWFFIVVQEVSGADTSASRVAGTNSAPDTSSPYDSGTVALTGGGIFATCLSTYSLFALTFTPDAAFTLADEQESADHMTGAAAYRIVTTNTTDSGTFTSSANDDGVIVLAVYKESSGAATLTVSVSDAVSVSESANVAIETTALTVNLNDAVEVTDTPSAVLPNALAVNVADTVTVGENYDVALVGAPADLDVSVSDTVFVIEPTFVGFETPVVTVIDNVTVGESVTVILPDALITAVADAITLAENHVAEVVTTITASETVSAAESAAVILPDALAVDIADAVTIDEAFDVNVVAFGTLTVSVDDAITADESVNVDMTDLEAGVQDAAGVTDTAIADVITDIAAGESVTVAESVTVILPDALFVTVSDETSVTDETSVAIGSLPDLYVSVAESVELSESASALFGCAVYVTETVTADDIASAALPDALGVAPSDVITTLDAASASIVGTIYIVQVSESVAVAEIINAQPASMSDTGWSRFNRQWQRARKHYVKTGRFHK